MNDVSQNEQPEAPLVAASGKSFMPMVGVAVVAVIAVIGVGIVATKGKSKPAEMMTASPASQASAADAMVEGTSTSAAQNSDVAEITMEAGSFYFKPNTITVKKGQKVKITFTSKDMMHDFYLDEFGVKGPMVKAGDTATIEFTPDKTGTFEYYCSVGQHRAHGQVGKLTVN